MLRHHLLIAFRNLQRHRLFSSINILGLAASMSLGLVLIGMLADLLRFDTFHQKKDQIYRVISHIQHGPRQDDKATTPFPLTALLKDDIDGIEQLVRIRRNFHGACLGNNKSLDLSGYFTDGALFKTFDFPLLYGNPDEVLKNPYSLVITKQVMDRMFDGKNPLGAELDAGDWGVYTITGVAKDVPKYSHLQFEMLGSLSSLPSLEKAGIAATSDGWDNIQNNYHYVLLRPGTQISAIEQTINGVAKKTYRQFENFSASFSLQALTAILPGRDLSQQIGPKMMYLPLFILSALALAILLSACFNYTNLSIARSIQRTREIGVRKTVGASRMQVIAQFLIEAIIITLFALSLGIAIFLFIRQGFINTIPRANELLTLDLSPGILLAFIAFALFAGLMAGIVPAITFSRISAEQLTRRWFSPKLFKRMTLRKALMVFQFALSLLFIIGTTVVYQQYRFSLHSDLGFDKTNILNISLQGTDMQRFQNTMAQVPGVQEMSFSSLIPGTGLTTSTWVRTPNMADSLLVYFISVDPQYRPMHQLQLKSGQDFPKKMPQTEESYIIANEALIEKFAWNHQEALDKVVEVNHQPHRILGVVKDFHYNHLEEPIDGFFFRYEPAWFTHANVKINSPDVPATMAALDKAWAGLENGKEFRAKFLEDQIEEAYSMLVSNMRIFGFLAFIAIAIACLGLLGMAVYTTEVRLKEVGIRKVFGAGEWQVVSLLSKGFVQLLGLAALIAVPIAWFLFDRVILDHFAFRIELGVVELGTGVLLLFLLGLSIISTQTWKAARSNPADILKAE